MTREHLLSKTLYGADIIHHIIREVYPAVVTHIKGDDCGEAPDPIHCDGTTIHVYIEKIYTEGKPLPDRLAKVHFNDDTLPDMDAIEFAAALYASKGEQLSEQQLLDRLAAALYIKEPPIRKSLLQAQNAEKGHEDKNVTMSLCPPPAPKFSFYRRPIRNVCPCRKASPQDIYKYLVSDYAKKQTAHLRSLTDPKQRRRYKADNFDYITPGGIFTSRKEGDLVTPSGYMVIDFDHIPDPRGLVKRLAHDEQFETILAFTSPSGDGVKWILALPTNTKLDGKPFTYGEFFTILSNYSRKVYGIEADPSGKDICRACFLPHDPNAFLNPFYLEDGFDYDIRQFLDGSAQ